MGMFVSALKKSEAEAKSWLGEVGAKSLAESINSGKAAAAVLAGCTIASETMFDQHRV